MNKQDASLRLTVLLGVLISLPALGTDMYLPALPALARALEVPVGAAQLTLTTFFIGLAAGQLLWGPLSDRFGRRPILAAGLAIMLVASLAAPFMQSVAGVAAARAGQGLGMSCGALVGRAIVRDLYAHEQAARLLARMTILFSLVPMFAPLAGALLVGAGPWWTPLAAMAGVAALILLLLALGRLRETAPAERRPVNPAALVRTFATIFGDRRFRAPFFVNLCAQLGILAWVSSSAFTLVRGFGMTPLAFALMFAIVMLGQITGSWASSRLVVRLGIGRMLQIGSLLMLFAGAAMGLLAWAGVHHWAAVVLPFMVFLFGTALILPNAMAAALTPFPQSAGTASSLIGAVGFTAGAVVSTLLGAAFDGTARPLATAGAIAGLGAFLVRRFYSGELMQGQGDRGQRR